MEVTLLHTNDFHGHLTEEIAREIAAHKQRTGAVLYADCGDCIKTGNLGIPLKPEPVWPRLHQAGCDVGTLGNRESHVLESAFQAKIRGHHHPLLVANLTTSAGEPVLPGTLILERGGLRIGLFGVMVAMVTEKMATRVASAFLWSAPIPAAIAAARTLRPQVDLLIALTHLGLAQDQKLAEACPEIDVIFGGHSHSVLESPLQVGPVWIAQTGSHARFLGCYRWNAQTRTLAGDLLPLKKN
ncbi:MAG TPA: hypothetical protein PLO61_11110 [Fimbriimonadaceae bacterium]|nr:hypothetical protein [Fimbriimonadaceae bacterium]HRJ34151.1 hypothetical protein [Fimbriimonadaceae bacterium]